MMTLEEEINELSNMGIVADDDFMKKSEAIRVAIEALRKAEKYRWHDLRKCPSDLPEEEGLVLVSLNGYHNKSTYDHAIDMVYWVCDGKFYDDMGMNVMVEAWREIEPFEDEKEHGGDYHGKT